MTREEAIGFLKEEKFKKVDSKYRRDWNDASDMAIEALSVAVSREDTVTLNSPISIQAEMVAVVRCKDCRWWNSETNGCNRNPSVEAWREDDFCKYGERREPCNTCIFDYQQMQEGNK